MLTAPARRLLQGSLDAIADVLARFGVSPDGLTVLGAALHIFVLRALAVGDFFQAALVMLVASGIDGIDGTLARRTDRCTPFGAFLDSSLDRFAEILIYLGLLLYAQRSGAGAGFPPWLVYLAITGSLMVSYIRARAEGAGFQTRSGWFTRLERLLVLWIGLLTGWIAPALWFITVGAWITTGQRITEVWRQSHEALGVVEGPARGR
jgi:CDP-diacylglycerol--glycerol-3-phosphate 3-phosphatidyltransferase